jgi:putative transposase
MEFKSNNNIVYSCKYHVVWCPKYRRKVLVGAVEARLKELMRELCADIRAEIIEMEIMPDHVHLLLSYLTIQTPIGRPTGWHRTGGVTN